MKPLKPFDEIFVPPPQPDQIYATTILDRKFRFVGLKAVLGAADISKAGDRGAGLAAQDEVMREAARDILSHMTVRHLYDHPLTAASGKVDAVMRANYEIDETVLGEIADLSLGQLKDRLMGADGAEIRRLGTALTGVMAAALAKLCDVHELIFLAKKMKGQVVTKARTSIGLTGTLSSRLQPNHPTDNLMGVSLLVYTGLSLGAGDAIFGLNPAVDTVENIGALLQHLDALRRETGVPTQICVLSHIKTQLQCLKNGDPVEIMFQSLAGTERTLTEEFDVTIPLLDEAYQVMAERGPLKDVAENWMYFETGQGSEVS